MSSEQEARDLQRAIENSLAPVSLGTARSTPDSGWTDRPLKRSRIREAPRAPRHATDPRDSEAVDQADHSLRVAAAKFLDTGIVRQRVGNTLYSALDRFRRQDTPNVRAKSRLAPKVERWDEGLELYRRGALRLTRTPGRGRANAPNCISLDDLVKAPAMLGMYSNTFLLEFDLIAPLLPILDHPHASRPVPIFLGQPLFADPFLPLACYHCGIDPPTGRDRPRAAQETVLAPALTSIYQRVVGRNLFMIHPKCSGCSHSKVFLVRYPGFVLLVITSANTMQLDMELCDNHWYIQAFPELTPDQASQKKTKRASSEFEQMLFCHLNELECPTEFISLLEDYDYSLASDLHLVVSQPGVVSAHEFDSRSIGRLASIARACIPTRERDQVEFEVCCGSVGAMSGGWFTSVDWLLRGKDPKKLAKRMAASATLEIASDTGGTHEKGKKRRRDQDGDVRGVDEGVDARWFGWKIVFPPKDYVATLSEEVKLTASNISSYWKTANWSDVPSRTKELFHQYVSKERGRLFHEKCILWLRAPSASSRSAPSSAPSTSTVPSSSPPHLVYIGSHNFSAAAWGTPELSKDRTRLKAKGPTNYEIGIVVEGDRIASMLERGSTWEDIVTYERPVEKFGPDDIPWVSPAWATSREE